MRILSLLPAATEIIYLLGLEKNLVGVSHECDFPSQAKKLPKVTSSPISNSLTSLEIDQAVKKFSHQGSGVFHINSKLLAKLKPDLILTQEICSVCAVGFNEVRTAARILNCHSRESGNPEEWIPDQVGDDNIPNIISLEPESVGDILENILLIGEKTGKISEARWLVARLKKRLNVIANEVKQSSLDLSITKIASSSSTPRNDGGGQPKVLVVEWLDPIMIAGHWVPEMVELAGGKCLLSKKAQKSVYITADQLKKLSPDIVIVAPCGFNINRTLKEGFKIYNLRFKNNPKIFLVDGNSYLTRPGPRVIDGVEIFSEIIHPELFKKNHTKKDWKILV